jgi:hypothetical protein
MEKQGSTPSELAMTGWLNASLAFEGLLRAGPEFDRASVIAATNAITDWTAGGLLQPIDWSTAHVPYTADEADQEPECVTLVRIQDGAFVPYASAEEPWLCFDGDDPNNFKPTPTNFG